ncbi:MAG: RluA family pseudouridine synthase [Lachnospiraceae bacterium]|nr:RluA family pseudouridine synthase [Lachnospiraceae bacterium]
MKEIVIDRDGSGSRLDKFLFRHLSGAPRSLLYAQLRKKNITLNGKRAQGNEILTEADRLQCWFSDETWEKFTHPSTSSDGQKPDEDERIRMQSFSHYRQMPILYENRDVLIVDKPAGLLVQRAERGDESLNDWLLAYLTQADGAERADFSVYRPSACHRLDRNTSGIVLCAKTLAGAREVSRWFRERLIGKYYLTLVHGHLMQADLACGLLLKDRTTNTVRVREQTSARMDEESEIKTAYAPVFYDASKDVTLVLARLLTGKTHQLRAQFADLGFPMVGDRKYGGGRCEKDKEQFHASSQLLHAALLICPKEAQALSSLAGRTITCAPAGAAWLPFTAFTDRKTILACIDRYTEVFAA